MFGTANLETATKTVLPVKKTGVRARVKARIGALLKGGIKKKVSSTIPISSTSAESANAIFGSDMHSILHLEEFFLVSSALRKNANLHTVPFSIDQLKTMYGYAILTLTFPSVKRMADRMADDLVIATAVSESAYGRQQYTEQTYPCWQLLMKGDLTPFLEQEARRRAIGVGLEIVDASLQAYVSAQIIEAKLKKTQLKHFVRTVDFPVGINKQLVISVSLKRKNRIAVKVMKTPTDIPKAIAFIPARTT